MTGVVAKNGARGRGDLPPLGAAACARVAALALPGGRVVAVRRLGGGIEAVTERLALRHPDGRRLALVARRYPAERRRSARAVREEGDRFRLLADLGLPVPALLAVDSTGALLDARGFLLSWLPGRAQTRTVSRGATPERWGALLARLHAIDAERAQSAWGGPLPPHLTPAPRAEEELRRSAHRRPLLAHPHGRGVRAALLAALAAADAAGVAVGGAVGMVHGDFWPGNVLWRGGEATALLDVGWTRLGATGLELGAVRFEGCLLGEPT